jgi:4-hydroxy-tetrahydrodipicolinate synthase
MLNDHARARLSGAHTALITPFTESGELDLESLETLCGWQLGHGVRGLSIGGSTGEPGTQSVAERIEAMRVVARMADGKVPFLAGTGSPKIEETFALMREATELGTDLALIVTPYYARPTQEGLYQWYASIARQFPSSPIAIYNVPARTSVEIAPVTVQRLANDFEKIVGIKETTRDFGHFSQVYFRCGPEFMMWSGIGLLCLPLLALGGSGFINALSNIAPGAAASMYSLDSEGKHDAALDLHYRLHPLVELPFVETNPAPAKWLLQELGVISSATPRPPLVLPSDESKLRITELLNEAREFVPPASEG